MSTVESAISSIGPAADRPRFFLDWLKPLAAVALIALGVSLSLRVGLWLVFGLPEHVAFTQLPQILAVGLVNDLCSSVFMLAPLLLLLALAPRQRSASARRTLAFAVWAILLGFLFVAASEYFFFEEFDSRFNLVAVDYLIYPTEVIGGIRDEYPVGMLLALFAVVAAVGTRLMLPAWAALRHRVVPSRRLRVGVVMAWALLAVAVASVWNAEAFTPFSNRVSNELAANGPSRFVAAFRTNHIDYDAFYRTGDATAMVQRLREDLAPGGGRFLNPTGDDLTRRHAANPQGLGRLNVVVIVEESLGAEFVGAYGSDRGLTPNLDQLSRESLMFTRAYATGTRTVRGLEAISASLPPIPSESIVKREGNRDIATWAKVMNRAGYRSSFLYGGYGAFDNMAPYFGGNGFAVSDRSEIEAPRFENVWGVSDEDLFDHALTYYDAEAQRGRPFFSMIMTTSNHKPYTFPEGVEGVKPRGGGRPAGARYADHALGRFLDAARQHAWFDRTLFVVVADHDARVYGKVDIPLNTYEIPLLLYAPGHLKPGRIDTPTSQIDIAPTVLGLLGFDYEAPFFGQDVLRWPAGQPRTLLFNHNHDVAALKGDTLCVLGLRKTAHCQTYIRLPGAPTAANARFEPRPDDRDTIDLATAYYQTAYTLFTQGRYR
jgi:phosphoglycerol transferase MdoB-like AlkP superfamily enzyme